MDDVTPILPPARLVETADEIRASLLRFNAEAAAHPGEARSRIVNTDYWVWDRSSGLFAPSKFCGFANMNFARYLDREGAGITPGVFQGQRTHAAMSRALGAQYQPRPEMIPELRSWASSLLGGPVLDHLGLTDRVFIALGGWPRERRYWAFLANPKRYDIEGAIRALDEDAWMVPEGDVRAGDRAVLWKAKGRDERRGVVALAEVLSDPQVMDEPEASHPFWHDERPAPTRRVRIRYVRPLALPLWFDDHQPPELDALTVSRGQGSGPYIVTADQWEALLALAGGWTAAPEDEEGAQQDLADAVERTRAKRRGQGFSADPEFNRAVELRGMAIARAYFEAAGWTVRDTSANRPYDLEATRDGQTRYIEVKGTTGGPEVVTLTYNEVEHARAHPHESVLFVVHGIVLKRDAEGRLWGTGGESLVVEPWRVDEGVLRAIAYRYEVPDHRALS